MIVHFIYVYAELIIRPIIIIQILVSCDQLGQVFPIDGAMEMRGHTRRWGELGEFQIENQVLRGNIVIKQWMEQVHYFLTNLYVYIYIYMYVCMYR